MADLAALSLAPAARDWLVTTRSARVLNVFDRACNLVNQDGAVLALVASERGLNPFALVVASDGLAPFRSLSPSSPVTLEPHRLVVGPVHVELRAARLWDPVPDWPALRQRFAAGPSALDELSRATAGLASAGSLLDLLGAGLPGSLAPRALLERARRGAADLAHGLMAASAEQCAAGARALAGLGGGLTPAGDDFIVGVFLAAWAGLYGPGRHDLCPPTGETAAPLTTILSAAYLRAAARGECMASWHVLFDALLRSSPTAVRAALSALLSVGHTSGADALAGFVAIHHLSRVAEA